VTKGEFDQLDSNGTVPCPSCGGTKTEPQGGCHCPGRIGGYGTRHINKFHHRCSSRDNSISPTTRWRTWMDATRISVARHRRWTDAHTPESLYLCYIGLPAAACDYLSRRPDRRVEAILDRLEVAI